MTSRVNGSVVDGATIGLSTVVVVVPTITRTLVVGVTSCTVDDVVVVPEITRTLVVGATTRRTVVVVTDTGDVVVVTTTARTDVVVVRRARRTTVVVVVAAVVGVTVVLGATVVVVVDVVVVDVVVVVPTLGGAGTVTVIDCGEPASTVLALPAVSATEKVPDAVSVDVTAPPPAVAVEVAFTVQTVLLVCTIDEIADNPAVSTKSVPLIAVAVVDSVAQSRPSLPVTV